MKLFKKIFVLGAILAIIFGVSVAPASAATKAVVAFDGSPISISASYGTPYIDSASRMQVPIRVIAEKLGAKVSWDSVTNTATINGTVKIKAGSSEITTAYGTITMDTTAFIKNGRIYIPVKSVANAMGYGVSAASQNGIVTADITTKVDLTISAAASLKDAMGEIKTLYAKEKPKTNLIINFGGSGTLQQQIEQGADVDLFFSAATSNMDTLKNKGLLIDGTVRNLLGNKLVLVVPNDSTLSINSFAGVTDASVKKIALGEATTVPAGKYAEQVFTYLKILDQVKGKAVYGSDVKQVLNWVETGNVDAGVVYLTDAKISTKVKVAATASEESHKAIVYPAALIKTTNNYTASRDFLNFLTSDKAKAVFDKYGFEVL
ncbi:MAG TPA: molybdate ABC transporter substrate-binding protein [Syntrophomonas sp.]|nr:molybdate ABC transporter substrate-binding protein [Syntrophomonas sp.]